MEIGPGGDARPARVRREREPRPTAGPALPAGPLPAGPHAASRLSAPFQQFFTTSPVACPYVEGRAERKLIIELTSRGAAGFFGDLSRAGFRRSHRFAYRPACRGCASCVPVRIVVDRFRPTRSLRRVRNANRDLTGRVVAARATPEQFHLFVAYQRSRHSDSDMAAMSYADYRGMIEDTPVRTEIAEFRDPSGQLVAASLIDRLDDGVSAVYSFYDPLCDKRSLGTWSVLWLVEACRREGSRYVYLGYWVAESGKMAYKARFPALERLTPSGWSDFVREDAAADCAD